MHYGKLQGEICAAGHIAGATGSASLVGLPFNIASVARVAGAYAVTLKDGVDPLQCAVIATADTSPGSCTANNGGVDTDTVKNIVVVDAAGAPLNVGFYITVVRTAVEP